MRVMITGAAGLVGSTLRSAYPDAFTLSHRDLDITDADAVVETVERLRPDVVFNCAVIGVDECERDPDLAARVNVDGPAFLAMAAERIGATIVHFSSNYVFDGGRTDRGFYTIEDEPLPINVYGVTKLRGERAVAEYAASALIIRTSWVFGAAKASFLSTVASRLARDERVQAITDTFASTTFVGDLVSRTMELLRRGEPGTYHVVNDGVCSYEEFALEAARLVGADESLIERTIESRLAPRPRWTPMRCLLSERLGFAPLQPWRAALAAYVAANR